MAKNTRLSQKKATKKPLGVSFEFSVHFFLYSPLVNDVSKKQTRLQRLQENLHDYFYVMLSL